MVDTMSCTAGFRTNSFVGTEGNSALDCPYVRCIDYRCNSEYIAPEVIAAKGHTAAVDWWTLGILIYEMIFATTPFKGKDRTETFAHIRHSNVHWRDTAKISSAGKDIILRLLDKNETTRLGSKSGASELKNHKWFNKINWGLLRHSKPPIVPTSSNGVDAVNFRAMKDSHSLHFDRELPNGQVMTGRAGYRDRAGRSPGTPSLQADDGMEVSESRKDDLFGGFHNVTLRYDGES